MLITATKRIEDSVLITICPAPITPPSRALPFVFSRLVSPLLDVVLVVQLAERGAVVLQLVHVVRQLVDQRGRLRRHRRDGRGDEPADEREEREDNDGHRRPAPQAVAGKPDHDRVQARRDEEREPDQDQHRVGLEQQLHQPVGDGDARGGLHPDHEGRAGVQRLARLSRARPLPRRVGGPDRLAKRVVLGNLTDAG